MAMPELSTSSPKSRPLRPPSPPILRSAPAPLRPPHRRAGACPRLHPCFHQSLVPAPQRCALHSVGPPRDRVSSTPVCLPLHLRLLLDLGMAMLRSAMADLEDEYTHSPFLSNLPSSISSPLDRYPPFLRCSSSRAPSTSLCSVASFAAASQSTSKESQIRQFDRAGSAGFQGLRPPTGTEGGRQWCMAAAVSVGPLATAASSS